MNLISIYNVPDHKSLLYSLLLERTPEQSISHKEMPSLSEHIRFIESEPYKAWYMIDVTEKYVGAIYLTHFDEIGVFIFNKHKGNGYAKEAIAELMKIHPGRKLANVNPANIPSYRLFESLGKVIQHTFLIEG